MHRIAILVFVFFVTLSNAQSCFEACSFKLCSGNTSLTFGEPDVALTGSICLSSGTRIRIVASTGEAMVNGVTKISQYAPSGLRQKFSPSFFKGYGSGIGHETPQQNQASVLSNLCVSVPLLAYSVTEMNGVVHNHVSSDPKNCVALRVVMGTPMTSPTAPTPPPPTRTEIMPPSMPPRPTPFITDSMPPMPSDGMDSMPPQPSDSMDSITPLPSDIMDSIPPLPSDSLEPDSSDFVDFDTAEPLASFGADPSVFLESLTPRPSESAAVL